LAAGGEKYEEDEEDGKEVPESRVGSHGWVALAMLESLGNGRFWGM
jgi:hypothetical protein